MPLKPEEVDLGSLAAEAVASLGPWQHATVAQSNGTGPVRAKVDPDLIRRVIANLVGNALKFSPQGGEVRLEVDQKESRARIRVRDRGRGIPKADYERIFEKFGQSNGTAKTPLRSTGLGLTFCKLAVEAHGGKIGVESEVGIGSTFWVELPAIG